MKVTGKSADGKDVEIEIGAVPGYVPEADIAGKYVPRESHEQDVIKLKGQLRDAIQHRKDALLEDDEFKALALETWGLDGRTGGGGGGGKGGKPDEKVVEKLLADLRVKEVEPLAKKLADAEKAADALQERILHARLVEVGAGRVKPALLKAARPGAPPPLLSLMGMDFVYLEDAGDFAEYDPATEGPRLSAAGKKDGRNHQYVDVAEAFETWAGNADHAEFLVAPAKQGGAGFQGAGSGAGAGGVKTVDGNDPVAVGRNLEAIAKGEVRVVKAGV